MDFIRLVDTAKKIKELTPDFKRNFHVTFILNKKKLISIGVNSKKTHTCSLNYKYRGEVGTHSELAAINQLRFRGVQNFTVVNIRLNSKNEVRMSKPCCGCADMLKQFSVKKVYYSTNDGTFESTLPIHL